MDGVGGYGAGAYIAFATLMFTFISSASVVSWFLASRMNGNRNTYLRQIEALKDGTGVELNNFKQEVKNDFAKAYRELGEGPRAIREKINQLELFVRDEYLLKKDYERDQDRILKAIDSLNSVVTGRMDRLEKLFIENLHPGA